MDSCTYKVQPLPSPVCQLGEGPVWDVESQSLFYVDIIGASIHRFDYGENRTYSATIDNVVSPMSFIFLVDGQPGRFLLGTGTSLSLISWDGKSSKGTLLRKVAQLSGVSSSSMRFNDGKVDRLGRLYAGTMSMEDAFTQKDGKLYRFDGKFNGTFFEQKHRISISNGITWDERRDRMYYVDSMALDVKEFDVNGRGDLLNERVLIDFSKKGEHPSYLGDGMTNDCEGNLYVAAWCGSKVLKVDPLVGKVVEEIKLPVVQVTSVAFGGPQLDELFVTSACTEVLYSPLAAAVVDKCPPGSGLVFKISGLRATGIGMYKVILKE